MIKAYYQLVRDKVPQLIKKDNKKPIYKKILKDEFYYYLLLKLKEETDQLVNCKKDNIENISQEISDIYEILNYIQKELNISPRKIKSIRNSKNKTKGKFDKKLFLLLTEDK